MGVPRLKWGVFVRKKQNKSGSISVQVVAGPIRRHVPVLMAIVLVVVGVLSVLDRSAIPFERAATVGSVKAISITDPSAATGEEGSCCKKH